MKHQLFTKMLCIGNPKYAVRVQNNPNLEILNGDVNEAYHPVGMF